MTDQNHAGTSQVMLEEFIKGDVPELKRIYDSVMAGNPLNGFGSRGRCGGTQKLS